MIDVRVNPRPLICPAAFLLASLLRLSSSPTVAAAFLRIIRLFSFDIVSRFFFFFIVCSSVQFSVSGSFDYFYFFFLSFSHPLKPLFICGCFFHEKAFLNNRPFLFALPPLSINALLVLALFSYHTKENLLKHLRVFDNQFSIS